jgi:hypothetical protein
MLSFYERARNDKSFAEAFEILQSKLADGQIVVERVVPKLASCHFAKKAGPVRLQPSGIKRF